MTLGWSKSQARFRSPSAAGTVPGSIPKSCSGAKSSEACMGPYLPRLDHPALAQAVDERDARVETERSDLGDVRHAPTNRTRRRGLLVDVWMEVRDVENKLHQLRDTRLDR